MFIRDFYQFVSVCFGLLWLFRIGIETTKTNRTYSTGNLKSSGLKHRNKPKKKFLGFAKQTKKQPKQIEFWFVSV
jgi:hypothetical protein